MVEILNVTRVTCRSMTRLTFLILWHLAPLSLVVAILSKKNIEIMKLLLLHVLVIPWASSILWIRISTPFCRNIKVLLYGQIRSSHIGLVYKEEYTYLFIQKTNKDNYCLLGPQYNCWELNQWPFSINVWRKSHFILGNWLVWSAWKYLLLKYIF